MFYSPFENTVNNLDKIKESLEQEKIFFEEFSCPYCKTRISDLRETGYVGCSECYRVFHIDLGGMIADFHKASVHVGKRPEKMASKARKQKQIEELLVRQAEASKNEDYLLAQSIKEQVEKLRSEL